MAAAVGAIEDILREYLLYRGFVLTLKAFDQERKEDKDKGLRVQRVIDYILSCIAKSDFIALQNFWGHLSKRFYIRLSHDLTTTAIRLETSVLRLFLINAHRNSKHEEIKMFFERMAPMIQEKRDWKDWFALPFTKNAEQHPSFKLYYSRDWYDSFVISLHNFFSTMFSALPLPTLLQFEQEHEKIQKFSTENTLLHTQLASTKESLSEVEHRVQKLEAEKAQQAATQASATRLLSTGKSSKPTPSKTAVATHRKSSMTIPSPIKAVKSKLRAAKSFPAPGSPPPEVLDVPEQSNREGEADDSYDSGDGEVTPHATPTRHLTELESDQADATNLKGADTGQDTHEPFMVVDERVYNEHNAPITHCQFSPNGVRVASVDTMGSLRVWEPTPSSLVTKARADYISPILSMDWVHSGGNDKLLVLGNSRGEMLLLDTDNSMLMYEFQVDKTYPRIFSLACSPATPLLAVASAAAKTHSTGGGSWSTHGLTAPSLPSHTHALSEMVPLKRNSLSFEPIPGQLCLWDLNVQKLKSRLPVSPEIAINCMAFNHNSNLLVAGGVDGMIRLYDVVQEECLFGWTAHTGQIHNLQFSSDENTVFSIGDDGRFCQWSTLRSTEQVASYPIHPEACNPAAHWNSSSFSSYPSVPRGNLFAFESEDKYVLTCSLQSAIIYQLGAQGSLSKMLGLFGHKGPVTCVDWVPGRRSLSTCVTGSVDQTVRVVNLLKDL